MRRVFIRSAPERSHLSRGTAIDHPYTSKELQTLLKHLPDIENDSRYLSLKILFKKRELFEYLKLSI